MPLQDIQRQFSATPSIQYQMRPKRSRQPSNGKGIPCHYSSTGLYGNGAIDHIPDPTSRQCIDVIVDVHRAPVPRY